MSNRWITSNDLPDTLTCVRVFFPSGENWSADLRGALTLLAQSWNWEQIGSNTPDETAQLWRNANDKTFKWEACVSAGVVQYFAGGTIPDGFLACNGGSYDPGDYPDLFDAIGYDFGGSSPGDFDVPDMLDRYVRSTDKSQDVGHTSGQNSFVQSEPQMADHHHSSPLALVLAAPGALPVYGPGVLPTVETDVTGGNTAMGNEPAYIRLMGIISTGET